jgi:hypothetical protein
LAADDAAAACGTPSATPSAIAGAAKINLRITYPPPIGSERSVLVSGELRKVKH